MKKNLKKILILILGLLFTSVEITAQRTTAVDNKGTIKNVNMSVTASGTIPTDPLEGDIWIDTTPVNHLVQIYDVNTAGTTGVWRQLSKQNIYTENGTLTSDREVNGGGKNLRFNGLNNFHIYDTQNIQLISKGAFGFTTTAPHRINLNGSVTAFKDFWLKGSFQDASYSKGRDGQVLSAVEDGTGAMTTKWVFKNIKPIESTTTDFTLDEYQSTLILNNTTPITITIPDASTAKGRIYIIKTNTLGSATLSRDYIPTDRIPLRILANSLTYHLQSDGTNWQQIN